MITHVAEADENRGRVVLWLGGSREPQDAAVDAALCLARAFQSEVESLFIEDRQIYDLAELPFSREISLTGLRSRSLEPQVLGREMHAHAAATQRQVLSRARAQDIRAQARVMRGEPVQALAEACTANGPWNVVTVGAPLRRGGGTSVADVFATVDATTGVVVAGPKARRTSGPVIAMVEEAERAVPMMRAAERIASATGGEARLWLLDHDAGRLEWTEGQVRLALGAHNGVKLEVVDMTSQTPWSVAHMLRRAGAGFVITRFGGLLAQDDGTATAMAEILEGPLFLVR